MCSSGDDPYSDFNQSQIGRSDGGVGVFEVSIAGELPEGTGDGFGRAVFVWLADG